MPLPKRTLTCTLNAAIMEAHATVDYFTKRDLHKAAKKFFKMFATSHLGLTLADYEIRSNLGGDAVAGEITLHTDKVYIQIHAEMSPPVLIRECNGRKDFTGKTNNWSDVNGLMLGHHILRTNYPEQYKNCFQPSFAI